jgi:hypothetical protein
MGDGASADSGFLMRVTIRDLFAVSAIVGLLACWRISHLQIQWQGQLATSRQQELATARQRESELTATVDRLTARLDEYENQHVLMRRLLLMPTKLLP